MLLAREIISMATLNIRYNRLHHTLELNGIAVTFQRRGAVSQTPGSRVA